MGAQDFSDQATGRTCDEAYNHAVINAQHEFGHDPYNGTISTTNGCRLIPAIFLKGLQRKTKIMLLQRLVEGDRRTDGMSARAKQVFQTLLGADYEPQKWGPCTAIDLGPAKGGPRGYRIFYFAGLAVC